jgi:RimJ/RimL family protein N-acetyltransferase
LTDSEVSIRPFTLGDVVAVTAACQDPEISRWTATIPFPYSEEDARGWIASHDELWASGEAADFAAVRATNGEFVGAVGLRPIDWRRRIAQAGYWVAAWARRQGIATRALVLVTEWVFNEVGLVAIELVTQVGNVASERVAQKAGFQILGRDHDFQHPIASEQHFDVNRWELQAHT